MVNVLCFILFVGNSKALVDEEKFRKNGKKKYETLSEKLLHLSSSLQSHAHSSSGIVPVDATGVYQTLSSQAQSIIKSAGSSKVQERVELMHLHTMTHGTRRWSGGGGGAIHGDKEPSELLLKEESDALALSDLHIEIVPTSSTPTPTPTPTNTAPASTLISTSSSSNSLTSSSGLQKPSKLFGNGGSKSSSHHAASSTPGTNNATKSTGIAKPSGTGMSGASRVAVPTLSTGISKPQRTVTTAAAAALADENNNRRNI